MPPHLPLEAKPADVEKFALIRDAKRRTMPAMMASLDENVGRGLDKLRETKLEEDTLVFFLGDNGSAPQECVLERAIPRLEGPNARRRHPRALPCAIEGPPTRGRVYRQPVISLHILPTALAAAGVDAPPDWNLDGVDLLPYLTGAKQGPPHESLDWRFRASPEPEFYDRRAIRQGDWKLVETHMEPMGLYNLATDIGESKNRAHEEPERVAAMRAV